MSTNEFDCLSNQLLQASLRCELLAAFVIPEEVRSLLQDIDVRNVRAVTVHQCPKKNAIVDYEVEVRMRDGSSKAGEFQAVGPCDDHDTYVLYDRDRDGLMKHLHLLH